MSRSPEVSLPDTRPVGAGVSTGAGARAGKGQPMGGSLAWSGA